VPGYRACVPLDGELAAILLKWQERQGKGRALCSLPLSLVAITRE
jgi:hypothetical protein